MAFDSSTARGGFSKLRERVRLDTIKITSGTTTASTLEGKPFFDVPLASIGSGFTAAKTYSDTNVSVSRFPDDELYAITGIKVVIRSENPSAGTEGAAVDDVSKLLGMRLRLQYSDTKESNRWDDLATLDCVELASQTTHSEVGALVQSPALVAVATMPAEAQIMGSLNPYFRLTAGADASATIIGNVFVSLYLVGGPVPR